jgi:hypothetical protein
MKKSVRINLLVITIVVTLFVFGGLWFLRPGVSDDILEKAKLRQSQPLMTVVEPLRVPKAEDHIDTTQIVKEVQQQLESSVTAAVKAALLKDSAFLDALKDPIDESQIARRVATTLANDHAFISSVGARFDFSVERDQLIHDLVPVVQPLQESILDDAELDRRIAETVDAQIPRIVAAVVERIEENKDLYVAVARQELSDFISEDEVVDLYLEYRSALVQDLVPTILDDVERSLKEEVVVPPSIPVVEAIEVPVVVAVPPAPPRVRLRIERMAVEEPVVVLPEEPVALEPVIVEPIIEEIEVPIVEPEPAQVAVVEEPPTPEVEPALIEEPVVEEPAAPIVEPEVAEEPAVEQEPEHAPAIQTEDDYEAKRQQLRKEAIDEVLKRIGQ